MQGKLTTRAVEALRKQAQTEARALFLWDTELRGFGARASGYGRVSWLVQKWGGGRWDGGGKAKRTVIAHYPPMGVDEARRQAGIAIGDTFKGSPLVGRRERVRKAKREHQETAKLGDAIELYLKRNSKPGRYWRTIAQDFVRDVVSVLGSDTPITSITKRQLRHLIETKQDKAPASARNLFAMLRPFFNWCVERDLIATSPLRDIKPPPKVDDRDRVLTDAEIKLLWQATDDLPMYGPCCRLLLLTGQRREEVGRMCWSELDLAKGEWIIPKERTKNGKEHLVHLSPQALAILKTLPELEGTDLVFATPQTTPIAAYSRAKLVLDKRMPGVPPWVIHDLRRTAASGMAALGFQPHVIERVLNHVSGAQGGLVGVYQRYEYQEDRKRALHAWGSHVEALLVGAQRQENVVPFRA
jgi:integrase